MDIAAIDQVRLNFNAQGLFIINAAIGLMMLGVALDLKLEDFKRITVSPKAPALLPFDHDHKATPFYGLRYDTGGSMPGG